MSEYVKQIENLIKMGLNDDTIRHYYHSVYSITLPDSDIKELIKGSDATAHNLVELLKSFKAVNYEALEDILKGREPSELEEKYPDEYALFKKVQRINKWCEGFLKARKTADATPTAPEIQPDNNVLKAAMEILNNGKPIDYLLNAFHKDYVGGEQYGRLLIFSGLCSTCDNTSGLPPSVDGDSGAGKTFAMQTMGNLLPEDYFINGIITPRALFYDETGMVKRGTTMFLDDVGNMPEAIEQLIKVSCSNYQKGFTLSTVIDKKTVRNRFPECINFWITGVEANSFDIQILNRSVNVGLDEPNKRAKAEHDEDIFLHQVDEAETGRPVHKISEEVLICRELTGHLLKSPPVNVVIPFIKDVDGNLIVSWLDSKNPRNFTIVLDMIRVSASIHRYQRKTNEAGSIIATLEDYDNALLVWEKVSTEQTSKHNKKDQVIIQALGDLNAHETPVDLYKLSAKLGKPYNTIYQRIFGTPTRGIKGLCERYDGIEAIKEHDVEYDKKIDIIGEGAYERESEKTTGSRGMDRWYIRLKEKVDYMGLYSKIITIDRERAQTKLDTILNNPSTTKYKNTKVISEI